MQPEGCFSGKMINEKTICQQLPSGTDINDIVLFISGFLGRTGYHCSDHHKKRNTTIPYKPIKLMVRIFLQAS
jgi:hypothetical protein